MHYYDADITTEIVGTSIPATEHSVMCAYGAENEYETYKRLITVKFIRKGLFLLFSDTWDLWKVLSDIISPLKEDIMNREGKVVIRPDSGDPVEILCGKEIREFESEEALQDFSLRGVGKISPKDIVKIGMTHM